MRDPGRVQVKAMCAVFRNGSEILVSLGKDTDNDQLFGRVIGGGVEFGETAQEALQREFMEELGTTLVEVKFVSIIENIFMYHGEKGHEVTFLYTGRLADAALYTQEEIPVLDSPDTRAVWLPLSSVRDQSYKLYPEFDYESLL